MEAGDRPEIKKRWIGELAFSYLSGLGGEIPAIGRPNLSHFGRLSRERYVFPYSTRGIEVLSESRTEKRKIAKLPMVYEILMNLTLPGQRLPVELIY
jgi:hypothetical protein